MTRHRQISDSKNAKKQLPTRGQAMSGGNLRHNSRATEGSISARCGRQIGRNASIQGVVSSKNGYRAGCSCGAVPRNGCAINRPASRSESHRANQRPAGAHRTSGMKAARNWVLGLQPQPAEGADVCGPRTTDTSIRPRHHRRAADADYRRQTGYRQHGAGI